MSDEAIGAVLMQLADLRDRVTAAEGRYEDMATNVTGMSRAVGDAVALRSQLDDVHGEVRDLGVLLATIVPDDGPAKAYVPNPSMPIWDLKGEPRDELLTRLEAWVADVLPSLGVSVADCVFEHPSCLYALDVLSELHSTLWKNKRTPSVLSGQSEFLLRHLPGLVDAIARETKRCEHTNPVDIYPIARTRGAR